MRVIPSNSAIGLRDSNPDARSGVFIFDASSDVPISEVATIVSISRTCGPGASASNSWTHGFASASTIGNESSMGFGPSFQVGFLADGMIGGNAAPLNTGSMSSSNLDPRLWVLLRSCNCANFAKTNVRKGPREGRHASGHNQFPFSVYRVMLGNEIGRFVVY